MPPHPRRARSSLGRRPQARAGMTLIEVLIVVIIMAFAAAGITYSLGALTRANLRSACIRVSAAARFAYGRAISQNTTVRLHFVFQNEDDSSVMSFEEAHGRVVLARTDDAVRQEIEEGETSAVDPWAAAQARMEDTLTPSFGASPFSQIEGRRYQPQELASNIRLVKVIVPHEPDPVEEGTADVYFFPGGQTEHAILQFADNSDRVYSVEIHPLTGRGRVYDYAYEPEELLDDGRGNQRSEVDD